MNASVFFSIVGPRLSGLPVYLSLARLFFSFSARAVRALTKKIYDGARASILRKKTKVC